MRAILILLFSSLLYADFTISYLIDNKIKQTVYYKDDNHIMFQIEDSEKTLEKLFIINSKKYISFEENGIEHIFEISDKLSDNSDNNVSSDNNSSSNSDVNFSVLRVDNNISFNQQKASRWIVKDASGEKKSIIVTDNKALYKDIKKSIEALKKILPKSKADEASIFDVGNGWTILKSENLELLKYKESPLDLALFKINKELDKNEQKELSKEIEKCFTNVCCGKSSTNPQEINSYLNEDNKKWKLLSSAKCNYKSQKNIESAIYSYDNKFITVEMISKNILLGKIDSLKKEGLEVSNIKNLKLEGYETKEGYIPSVDATVVDITLPSATISLYAKGNINLIKNAKELLKLKFKSLNYTLSN